MKSRKKISSYFARNSLENRCNKQPPDGYVGGFLFVYRGTVINKPTINFPLSLHTLRSALVLEIFHFRHRNAVVQTARNISERRELKFNLPLTVHTVTNASCIFYYSDTLLLFSSLLFSSPAFFFIRSYLINAKAIDTIVITSPTADP